MLEPRRMNVTIKFILGVTAWLACLLASILLCLHAPPATTQHKRDTGSLRTANDIGVVLTLLPAPTFIRCSVSARGKAGFPWKLMLPSQNFFVTLLVCERRTEVQTGFKRYWRVSGDSCSVIAGETALLGRWQLHYHTPFHPLQVKMLHCSLQMIFALQSYSFYISLQVSLPRSLN